MNKSNFLKTESMYSPIKNNTQKNLLTLKEIEEEIRKIMLKINKLGKKPK